MSFFSQAFDPIRRFERQYAQFVLAHSQTIPWPGDAQVNLAKEFIPVRGLDAALASNPRIILTGRPGAGKTTTLAHLAITSARALLADERDALLPILFSAREFSKGNLPHVSALPSGLHLSESLAAQCPKDFFSKAIETRRALVLIDDLDTWPVAAARAWLDGFVGARVVATGRMPAGDLSDWALPGFRDTDMERALRQWDGGNPEAFIDQLKDAFFAQLKASGVPRALTANPMTFAMLVRVWQALHSAAHNGNEHPLPNRRTPLFETYARQVLGDSEETTKMLEGVALAFQRGAPAPNDAHSMIKSPGFLVDGINSAPEFVHPLWQAFFAARAMRHTPDHALVLDVLADPGWQEAVLFYAGMGEANDLVEALVAKGEFTFAGRVLAHSDQVRDDLHSAVSQELIRRAWEGDSEATHVLSEMGSEPAVDTLGARLKEKDPAVRARAARLLGELQLDRGIEYLLPQLRDVDGDVRDRVLEALGKARTDRVVEPLLVALRGDPRVGKVDTRLRVAAAKALGDVGSDRAVTALIVDLQVGEPEVRAVAAESLKRITSPLMLKPLLGILESGDEDARQYATDILAVVNGKRSWTH